ncbi:MAG: ABC transporter substrate-binding protein [Chloroflexi bacterium]|nr:ABC transporter substrate-binding protein [Chloroflexota bacterium]
MNRKLNVFLSLTLALVFVLAACAPASTPTEAPATEPPATDAPTEAVVATEAPAVDPLVALAEESKNEKDGLLVYSIMGENNWAPVIKAFNEKYPWITVTALDLGTTETFERYYTESAGGARTADMIITSAPGEWQEFIAKGELEVYKPVNLKGLPDFATLANGIYAVSTDPFIIIWNKQLVSTPPATMADIAALAADPAFAGKITTYDAEKNGTGHAINWFWTKKMGDAGWATLEAIGKSNVNMQTSAGNMVKAILSGEATVGYFVSGISVFPKFPDADAVMGWTYDKSGQVVMIRGMGLTKKAASPASAKLMMEFILSSEGQLAWSEGGLTAYRPDVADKAKYHLQKVIDAVGADNVIYFTFDPEIAVAANRQAFVDKWKTALGRP